MFMLTAQLRDAFSLQKLNSIFLDLGGKNPKDIQRSWQISDFLHGEYIPFMEKTNYGLIWCIPVLVSELGILGGCRSP